MRNLNQTWGWIARVLALGMATYHVATSALGIPEALFHRSTHLLFGLVLVFLLYPISKKRKDQGTVPIYDILLIVVVGAAWSFIMINRDYLVLRFAYVTPLTLPELLLGIAAVLLVLEATRRVVGIALPILAMLFLLYAVAGSLVPGYFRHRGVDIPTLIDQMYLGTEGIMGIPIAVSATYIILFIIFGAFLEKSGGGEFFIQLAKSIAGSSRGGTAKVAVVSSALMGTISGSAVANVVTTGSFTIPLMKRTGYKAHFAGAVEAAASSGGQIMPPIMGAAAFVMAEFSGIPYIQIIKHALIPATLYFGAVFFAVHFEALKNGLKGLPKSETPRLFSVLARGGHLLLPVVIIIFLLIQGYTPMYAALGAIISTLVLSWFRKETRMGPRGILAALEKGTKSALVVVTATACAGIIIGVVSLTGLGLKFTSLLLALSQGMLLPALVLTMVAALVLGMGLPTTPAYIVQAALLIPALIAMGVEPVAAHLFAVYFAVVSNITPPVAISSYAAAGVAGASAMSTAFTAVKLGVTAYIVPFMFVFSPALLLIGAPLQVITALVTACIGIYCLAGGLQRWLIIAANLLETAILLGAALTLIYPGGWSDAIGLGLLGVAFASQLLRRRQTAVAQ